MDTLSYKTVSVSKEDAEKSWYLVDAEDQVVGRIATQIASILKGKNKPTYTPHADTGDYVVVINAEKIRFTGKKLEQKTYLRHTGYPGGQRSETPTSLLEKKPEAIVEKAVYGMLPKNKLGRIMIKKLFVYAGSNHPHQAQKPQELKF